MWSKKSSKGCKKCGLCGNLANLENVVVYRFRCDCDNNKKQVKGKIKTKFNLQRSRDICRKVVCFSC